MLHIAPCGIGGLHGLSGQTTGFVNILDQRANLGIKLIMPVGQSSDPPEQRVDGLGQLLDMPAELNLLRSRGVEFLGDPVDIFDQGRFFPIL